MVLLQEIKKRRSPLVFGEDNLEKDKIEALIEAARWAPSCFNKQSWKYVFVHNLTEVFIYGALAAIFVPIMNLFSAVILLIGISIYDFIAVRKTKHMIKLAKAQSKARVFAGLVIPYKLPGKVKKIPKKKLKLTKIKTAILGGGDMGFPLLFAAVVMKETGFFKTLIIPVVVSIALFILLIIT